MTGARRLALLVLLGLAACLGYADRVAFSVAADAIRRDLALSDAAIGATGGFAFAALYAFAAIPLARAGDRGARLPVVVASVAVWSLATCATGRAAGFATLFAARIGVGLGEAGLNPSALPLIAGLFPPARHALATAAFWGLAYLGLVLGLWGGGELVDAVGWRGMFALLGLAGLPLAAGIAVIGRGAQGGRIADPVRPAAYRRDLAAVLRAPGVVSLLAFSASSGIVAWGGLLWDTPFYMRRFHLSASDAGFWFGIAFGLATVAGVALGGPVAELVTRRTGGGGRAVRVANAIYVAGQPFQVLAYASGELRVSLIATAITTVTGGLVIGPVFAALLGTVPAALRGAATLAYGMSGTLIGSGLGPPLFGLLSDLLRPRLGEASLQAALLIGAILGFWPALHLFALARTLDRTPAADLRRSS